MPAHEAWVPSYEEKPIKKIEKSFGDCTLNGSSCAVVPRLRPKFEIFDRGISTCVTYFYSRHIFFPISLRAINLNYPSKITWTPWNARRQQSCWCGLMDPDASMTVNRGQVMKTKAPRMAILLMRSFIAMPTKKHQRPRRSMTYTLKVHTVNGHKQKNESVE